jgi:hypothetical protein
MATASELQAEIARLRERLRIAQNGLASLNRNLQSNQTILARYANEVATIPGQIAGLEAQLSALLKPPQSAASSVATGGAAAAQNPAVAPQSVNAAGTVAATPAQTVPTNAEKFNPAAQETTGTNDPLRTAERTQATPATVATPGAPPPTQSDDASPNGPTIAVPNTSAGSAAPKDDQTDSSQTNPTRTRINEVFGGPGRLIVPQGNVLDKAASYTYNISLYMMSPAQYKKLLNGKQKVISGFQLLMSSGGAPAAAAAAGPSSQFTASDPNTNVGGAVEQTSQLSKLGRNQFFPLDYYIDDVKLKSILSGKGTQSPHNVVEMSFRITEPNGISFLDNLYSATQQYVQLQSGTGAQNYAAQNYLMVVRFYGYDQNGNPVTNSDLAQDINGADGIKPIVEKFIPFQFTAIKFRIANKLTEYECTAVCPQNTINTGGGRGVIPYNIELTGTTLKDLLIGNLSFKTTNQTSDRNTAAGTDPRRTDQGPDKAPPNAIAAPSSTLVSGLTDALNRIQQDKKNRGIYQHADEYEIVIVDAELQNAKTQPPAMPGTPTNQKTVAMVDAQDAAQAKDGKKQSVNSAAKNVPVVAGTSIMQFLDQTIRNSSYIYDQQTKIPTIDKSGKLVDMPTGQAADALAWYRVGLEAEQGPYDELRNDYSYKIKYQITMYKVNGVKSDYFPTSKFQGTHKVYNYWFTGQNNSVISLEQDYNYLYYIVVNTNQPTRTTGTTTDVREYEKRTFQPRSGQSDQMGQNGAVAGGEPGANAADYLYSPADQSRIKMTIVGDPAWIQQGEVWSGIQGLKVYSNAFLPDGTINFENQEALFEVAFNKPVDYDLSTGLMDPGTNNYESNRATGNGGAPRQRYVYKAVEVTSTFSRGKFTQDLEGVLLTFPLPKAQSTQTQDSKREPPVATNENETAKLLRQQNIALRQPPAVVATSVTGTVPITSVAQGTQQILNPPTRADAPSLSQLQASPVYIASRRAGATPSAALDAARAAFASGTNNTSGSALPGIRTGTFSGIVKDANPG